MKSILFALFLSLAQVASGSILRLDTVFLPLYLHGSDSDPQISFESVPFVTFHADPEWRFPAIARPFVPATDGTWQPHDVNLASRYGISLRASTDDDGKVLVTVDGSKALVPDGYPFSVEQVIDAVVTCVKLMYPPRPAGEGELRVTIIQPPKKPKAPK